MCRPTEKDDGDDVMTSRATSAIAAAAPLPQSAPAEMSDDCDEQLRHRLAAPPLPSSASTASSSDDDDQAATAAGGTSPIESSSLPDDGTKKSTFDSSSAAAAANDDLHRGTVLSSLSLALLVSSFSLTMPHVQSQRDALGCDSLCLGSMTSARSGLSLIGSALVGRLSDSDTSILARMAGVGGGGGGSGRRACLYVGAAATMAGLVISAVWGNSIEGLWLAMIPGALLQQNFSVTKALLSDYHGAAAADTSSSSAAANAAARAGSVGKLGMAVGLAFMVGPLLGATFVTTYDGAVKVAMVLTFLSGALVSRLPRVRRPSKGEEREQSKRVEDDGSSSLMVSPSGVDADEIEKKEEKHKTGKGGGNILSLLDIPAARSPPALFVMSLRICMALAFHIFHTIWTVSLKSRFQFGPADHGRFMSFVGLTYALSQGFVAKRVIALATSSSSGGNGKGVVGSGRGRVRLIQTCCLALGLGRYLAFQTSSLSTVYVTFGFIITALGVFNTILTADVSTMASSDEVGGLFGVLEAVENVAGMVGPVLGGMLALRHPVKAPLYAVVGLYGLVLVLVTAGYERFVLLKAGSGGGGMATITRKKMTMTMGASSKKGGEKKMS